MAYIDFVPSITSPKHMLRIAQAAIRKQNTHKRKVPRIIFEPDVKPQSTTNPKANPLLHAPPAAASSADSRIG